MAAPKPAPKPDPLDALSEEALDWLIAFFLGVADDIEAQQASAVPPEDESAELDRHLVDLLRLDGEG